MATAHFSRPLIVAVTAIAMMYGTPVAQAATPAASTAAKPVAAPAPVPVSAVDNSVERTPFYQELDKMAADHNALQVTKFINDNLHADHQLFSVAMHWLEMRGLHMGDEKDYDGNYLIMYSDYLHNAADALAKNNRKENADVMFKNALYSLMTAEAVLMADAKRCEDGTVMDVLRNRTLKPRFDALKDVYKEIPPAAYSEMSALALRTEETHGNRRPNVPLCTLGADAMNEMTHLPNLKKEMVADKTAKNGKRERLLLPEGYVYHPKLVADSAWGALRQDVRTYLTTDWQNRYKMYTGQSESGAMSGKLGGSGKK